MFELLRINAAPYETRRHFFCVLPGNSYIIFLLCYLFTGFIQSLSPTFFQSIIFQSD